MMKTRIEMFNQIASHLTDSDEVDFIMNEVEKIKREKANRKPSAEQLAKKEKRENLGGKILEILTATPVTASEIAEDVSTNDENYSVQMVTAVLSDLLFAGKVVREKGKRGSFYSIAGE